MKRRYCVYKTSWSLVGPIKITGHIFRSVDMVIVEVSEEGVVGRGEGTGVYYLHDFADGMVEQLEAIRNEVESGLTREALQFLLPPGGARNALDCALWDLDAKAAKTNVWSMAGLDARAVQTAYTIGIGASPEVMATQAADAIEYPLIKVKLDAEMPVERIAAIRKARPDAELIVDANQGFSFKQLTAVIDDLARLGVAMIEQPLPRGGDEALAGFRSPIPICADESCLHRGELAQALDRYDMINIKLDKAGGLTESLALAHEARAAGKGLMVGNMVGTSLAMSPAAVVAQLCDFADLDGPLALKSDVLSGMTYQNGAVGLASLEFWGGVTPA